MNTSYLKEKACKSCRKIKPVDDFYENKYSPDGRYAFCKTCFDRFALRLKEKEKADLPLNKTCVKCGKIRLIDEFEADSDAPNGKTGWCKACRQEQAVKPEKKAEKKNPPPSETDTPEAIITQEPPPSSSLSSENTVKSSPPESLSQKPAEPAAPPEPAAKTTAPKEPEDDFDFIEHLLSSKALEEEARLGLLKAPKQITKIRMRRRVCNGCGKTEEIDQVDKNTVIPVRAWFCEICRQYSTRRWIMKGMTVQDYWGREFKVKKVISRDEVIGVMKNTAGKWAKRPLTIYGQWKTVKD